MATEVDYLRLSRGKLVDVRTTPYSDQLIKELTIQLQLVRYCIDDSCEQFFALYGDPIDQSS